jgi:hypothetical protein
MSVSDVCMFKNTPKVFSPRLWSLRGVWGPAPGRASGRGGIDAIADTPSAAVYNRSVGSGCTIAWGFKSVSQLVLETNSLFQLLQILDTMGRWSSDCYRLYVRACFAKTLEWTRVCDSSIVSDVEQEFAEVDSY